MDWTQFGASLLDHDGVHTPTADVQSRVWHQMFSAYFVEHDVAPQHTNADYLPYVDGNCVTTAKLVGADLLVPDLAELMPT